MADSNHDAEEVVVQLLSRISTEDAQTIRTVLAKAEGDYHAPEKRRVR